MFEFLKNLFKEKTEEQEVKLEDIENWFKDKTNPIFSGLNEQIKQKLNEMKSEFSALKENIDALENAEIKDPEKIQPRVKNVVLGHKNNYLRVLRQFSERVNVPEADYKKTLEFCDSVEKQLDSLGKTSMKSYYAVQHLFSHQVEPVAKNLKNIDAILKLIKQEVEDKNIAVIERTERKLQELKDSIKKKQEFETKIGEENKRLDGLGGDIDKSEKKKTEMKQSNEFLESKKEKQRKSDIDEKLSSTRNRVISLFSPLESGLKKFQRITLEHETVVERYIKDSMNALLEDKELKIIELLANMKKNLESGVLDLRDRKKEKAAEQIDIITKEVLNEILDEYGELNRSKQEIEEKIKANKITAEINDANYKLDFYIQKKEVLVKDIASLESGKEKIDIDKIKNDLRELIRKSVNVDIVIS